MKALRIGISSCLLGDEVRWDGGHKLAGWLGDFANVEWVRVCPEMEIGLGVPREPIRLVREGSRIALRGVDSNTDVTERMADWSGRFLAGLDDLDGYVLKSRSPSCGLRDVPVEGDTTAGRGLFAEELVRAHPELPVAEETDLGTREGRERFVARARAYRRGRRARRARDGADSR